MITVNVYAWVSGMNIKTGKIWKEISLGIFSLLHSAMLFYFCNYGHYFDNIVRYQKKLFEKYAALFIYVTF
jgi:hypothetical protein